MAETTNTPFHSCIQTSLYRCLYSNPCWSTNTTLGSASTAKFFTFNSQTYIVLTGSEQSDLCDGEQGYVTETRVTTVEDKNFNVTVDSQYAVDSVMFESNGDIFLFIVNFKHSIPSKKF